MIKLIVAGAAVVLGLVALFCSVHAVPSGHRGVKVTFGRVDDAPVPEGLSLWNPLAIIHDVSVKQRTEGMKAECFSSDLQQVDASLKVLFRVPPAGAVPMFKGYEGDPFKALVLPRVHESLKEATATLTAEGIVKGREQVKASALAAARAKLGSLVEVDDLVIEDLALSAQLAHAIEAKMVQEQEAAKAKFTQQQAEVDARTAVVRAQGEGDALRVRAQGEADAIRTRGSALRANPSVIELEVVGKWDGKAPLYVGGGAPGGAGLILPGVGR